MEGRFTERETGAEYHVRELSDGTVVWVGEDVSGTGIKNFTNIFFGRRVSATEARGDFIDIPKGRSNGLFTNLRIHFGADELNFTLPGIGERTLTRPETDFPVTNFLEWGAGFYDEPPTSDTFSLTGVWQCNDGGIYYIRQFGTRVAWFGEHLRGEWSNVFLGEVSDSRLSGRWVDVPKGRASGSGEIRLEVKGIVPVATRIPGTRLERVNATGGFGGSEWIKTDSVRVAFRLRDLRIVRNADVGGINVGGDEPYLMPVYVTVGGNQYRNLFQLSSAARPPRPSVVSPLFQHPWGRHGEWPKNNLTWQEDLAPGTVIPVPDYVSYFETELRTLPGLQPNSSLGRDTPVFVPGIIALEEASTRHQDIQAGYQALLQNSSRLIHNEIARASREFLGSGTVDFDALIEALRIALGEVTISAIRASALSDFFGIIGGFDPDKNMGSSFRGFSFGMLKDAALRGTSIPVNILFNETRPGEWRVSGTISGSLGPFRRSGTVTELEVTFETGNDDKRRGSTVEIVVNIVGSSTRGSFRARVRGQRFADHSFHTIRVPLTPAVTLGNLRNLQIIWTRDPGGGWPENPDSWDLRAIRVVAFDQLGRRHTLLRDQLQDQKFDANRTLTIPLPRVSS